MDDSKYWEKALHQAIITALRNNELTAFVMNGFDSKDCLNEKFEKGKELRNEEKCECKINIKCRCSKQKYPELNIHEKDIMSILEIPEISTEELAKCINHLKEVKRRGKIQEEDNDSWLFEKVDIYL